MICTTFGCPLGSRCSLAHLGPDGLPVAPQGGEQYHRTGLDYHGPFFFHPLVVSGQRYRRWLINHNYDYNQMKSRGNQL